MEFTRKIEIQHQTEDQNEASARLHREILVTGIIEKIVKGCTRNPEWRES
jgi:hypothetical protein